LPEIETDRLGVTLPTDSVDSTPLTAIVEAGEIKPTPELTLFPVRATEIEGVKDPAETVDAMPVNATVTSPPSPPLAVNVPALKVISLPVIPIVVDGSSVPISKADSMPLKETEIDTDTEPMPEVISIPVIGTEKLGVILPIAEDIDDPVKGTELDTPNEPIEKVDSMPVKATVTSELTSLLTANGPPDLSCRNDTLV
jgi:hypothetical protein